MMRRAQTAAPYPESQYDEHLCLRPPVMLWLAALYLSRAITLPIAMAVCHFAGVNDKAIDLFRGLWSAELLVPSAMAATVLYALCRRVPAASRPVRWIWAHGRMVLAIAAVTDICLLLSGVGRRGEFNSQAMWAPAAAAIEVYFLLYVLTARRVRDVFAEFPSTV